MKTTLLGGAAAAAILAVTPALAQPAPPPPAPAPQVQMMRHPMKTQTRSAVVQHVRQLFARLDTNRDNYLTREESNAGHKQMAGDKRERFAKRLADRGARRGADRGAAFDRLDTNKDGVITRDEFANAQPQVFHRREFVMRDGESAGAPRAPGERREFRIHRMGGMGGLHGRMFETADANRDGRVSLQEATDAAVRHFDTADANHDGQLTPDERRQVRKIRIRRQPA
jgi:hypothetical protein